MKKSETRKEITLKVTCNQLVAVRTALKLTIEKELCPTCDRAKIKDVVEQIDGRGMDTFTKNEMLEALGIMLKEVVNNFTYDEDDAPEWTKRKDCGID